MAGTENFSSELLELQIVLLYLFGEKKLFSVQLRREMKGDVFFFMLHFPFDKVNVPKERCRVISSGIPSPSQCGPSSCRGCRNSGSASGNPSFGEPSLRSPSGWSFCL